MDKNYEKKTESESTEKILDSVANHVRERFNRALDHKRIIQTEMLQCLRQRKSLYDPGEACVDGTDVYMGISSKSARTVTAWVRDVFGADVEKPWTLEHTPIPELSDISKKLVVEQIKKLVNPDILNQPDVFKTPTMKKLVRDLKNTAATVENEIASGAADRMSLKIHDQMTEGGFREAFVASLDDLATFPVMVIKSPVYRQKKVLKWVNNKVTVASEVVLATERVSPFDIYPSAMSSMPSEGYICEVMRYEPSDLFDFIDAEHFNGDKIKYALDKHPTGYRIQEWTDAERQLLEKGGFRSLNSRDTLDVVDFWGRIPGKMLVEWGMKLPGKGAASGSGGGSGGSELDSYEVNAWLLDDVCIRCLMNPDPLQDRPYRVTSYEKIPGSFFGNGPLQLIRDIQRVCNAAARNLVRNLSYSSGPITEVEVGRLSDEETFDELVPYKVYFTEPDSFGGGRQAIRISAIPSVANELMAVYDKFEAMADIRIGIPRSADGTGGAQPRTIGVFSMQMANASKGIKSVISNLELDIIEPIVRAFWAHNMLHSDDESIKGDVKVVARGASGLLHAEHLKMQQREFMAALPPFLPALPKEDVLSMLSQMAAGLDLKFSFTGPGALKAALAADQNAGVELPPGGTGGALPLGSPQGALPGPGGALGAPGGIAGVPGGVPAPTAIAGPSPGTPPPRLDGRSLSQVRR